jgi:Fe-S-cluster-containing dehydrogenase component
MRVRPNQTVVKEGDFIGADDKGVFHGDFYIVRVGSLKVTLKSGAGERVRNYLREEDPFDQVVRAPGENPPRSHFGEIALLSDDPNMDRRRSASVIALDDVDLVRIPGQSFKSMCDNFPDIRAALQRGRDEMRKGDKAPPPLAQDRLGTYLNDGFFQGRSLLVLDLERCTRCDECTKACADAHEPERGCEPPSRLLREGPRFGKFLVATSCRSCRTPYCMHECPVDSIHREDDAPEVRIADHCIGCGLCARNCPYESIQMLDTGAGAAATVARKAVNCDLCHDLVSPGAEPFCVAACPHNAAFRWEGETLLRAVTAK